MRVLVLGGSGLVGSRFVELCSGWLSIEAPARAQLDVRDTRALDLALQTLRPDAVLNCVAWADVDGAEAQRGDRDGEVFQLNVTFAGELARLCERRRAHLVHISTDYVFDGASADRPYTENDPANPLCWYAQTKHLGEQTVLHSGASSVIARIEMPFMSAAHPKRDFPRLCLSRLRAGEQIVGVLDQRITPVFLDDCVRALATLIEARTQGVVHVAASSWTTPHDLARGIARRFGLDERLIRPEHFAAFAGSRPAARPQHSWLDVSHFEAMFGTGIVHSIDAELDAWAEQVQALAGAARNLR